MQESILILSILSSRLKMVMENGGQLMLTRKASLSQSALLCFKNRRENNG